MIEPIKSLEVVRGRIGSAKCSVAPGLHWLRGNADISSVGSQNQVSISRVSGQIVNKTNQRQLLVCRSKVAAKLLSRGLPSEVDGDLPLASSRASILS